MMPILRQSLPNKNKERECIRPLLTFEVATLPPSQGEGVLAVPMR